VSRAVAGERMSDFVQDHVAHFRLIVRQREMAGKLDPPQRIAAKPQRPFAPIERELPIGQAVAPHQGVCQFFNLAPSHRGEPPCKSLQAI
jgi:hypothetical protein